MLMAATPTFFCVQPKSIGIRWGGVRRFLDTGDVKLTSNMWKHTKKCWTAEVVAFADKVNNANDMCHSKVLAGPTVNNIHI